MSGAVGLGWVIASTFGAVYYYYTHTRIWEFPPNPYLRWVTSEEDPVIFQSPSPTLLFHPLDLVQVSAHWSCFASFPFSVALIQVRLVVCAGGQESLNQVHFSKRRPRAGFRDSMALNHIFPDPLGLSLN